MGAPTPPRTTVGEEGVSLVNDELHASLRRAFGVSDDFLAGNFDFATLASGGGKGGDRLGRTACKRFFVKELNPADRATITDLAVLRPYVERVLTKRSLLCRIYAHFERDDGSAFIVINNWLPLDDAAPWTGLYDLKGTADDKTIVKDGKQVEEKHKRCWHCGLMLAEATCAEAAGVPTDRNAYKEGKRLAFTVPFHVLAAQAEPLLEEIKRDTNFLSGTNLMDYSMIVGMRTCARDEVERVARVPGDGDQFAPPLVAEYGGKVLVYYVGIIDFLQVWNAGKQCAHIIKCIFAPRPISTIAPVPYARQFVDFFANKFTYEGVTPVDGFDGRIVAAATTPPLPPSIGASDEPASPPSEEGKSKEASAGAEAPVAAESIEMEIEI